AGRRELQEAGARRKAAVDRLTDAAGGILDEAGHGAGRASLDAVTNTLLAVATDPEAARLGRAGRLAEELPAPSGFGAAGGLAAAERLAARMTREAERAERRAAEARDRAARARP